MNEFNINTVQFSIPNEETGPKSFLHISSCSATILMCFNVYQ